MDNIDKEGNSKDSPQEESTEITREDMIDYVCGDAKWEMAEMILKQSQIPGTFAHNWMKSLVTAASNPFDETPEADGEREGSNSTNTQAI